MTVLKTAIATYPHTKGLKDGTVSVPGVQFEHVEVSPIIGAFRRMCRTVEFDICEIAITTYVTAKAHDKPFTALPVFLVRQFHHSPIVPNVEYGVDRDKIPWVVVAEEHLQEYRKPANVTERPGASLAEMLVAGELAAAIGVGKVDSPDVKPLIPDAAAAEAAWYRKTGIYPINHTVVVKDALLQSDPSLAPRLLAGFEAAKAQFLKQLSSGAELPADAQVMARRRSIVGDDPLPNGLARNRKALEAIVRFAHEQKILPRTVKPEEMFAANTLD